MSVIAVCHGGGPMPILGKQAELADALKHEVPKILKLGSSESPRAIALITAHWETDVPIISNSSKHELYYDYYNFPAEAYNLKYAAPGDPDVARMIFERFEAFGLQPKMDSSRGWDHGTFIPMMLINPDASVPIVQVSVLASQSPAELYKMGQALAALRDENIAILGSGSASLHNFPGWMRNNPSDAVVAAFRTRQQQWAEALEDALGEESAIARLEKLRGWRDMPHSYEMHPDGGAEHFSPLLVCAGAAGDAKLHKSGVEAMGAEQRMYWWT